MNKFKNFLKINIPFIFIFLRNIKRFILKIHSLIFNKFIHISLSSKRKGAKIIKRENGFILSFIFKNYFTFHLRPRYEADYHNLSTFAKETKDLAIIIQGNVGENFSFLLETCKIYKKIFPNSLIIISTWDDEVKQNFDIMSKLGVSVIFNKRPSDPGFGNINLQLVSTKSGLDLAKLKNLKYCIKTRADCRMNKNDIYPYLKALVEIFPLKKNVKANSRIVASSVNTCKYKIYGTTDILLFGHIDDMLIYFESTLFDESLLKYKFGKFPSLINNTPVVAETFLCARYLKNIGVNLEWTLDHWWECLRDYFCIIDSDSIDFLWKKKDWQYEKRFLKSYSSLSHRAVNFADWISLYNELNLNWNEIDYQEKWELNNNRKNLNEDLFKKKSLF